MRWLLFGLFDFLAHPSFWALNADPTFFPGRAATIYYHAEPTKAPATVPQKVNPTTETKDLEIGRLGILHPSVLEKFEIGYPCSALEFSLEPFKAKMSAMWANDDI
jgi:phenylalanyl-tRNA synthetase beta chain